MKRIRINNDFTFAWAIERNGLPEDLSAAINMVLKVRNSAGAIQVITDYKVAGNIVSIEVTPKIANVLGRYVFILTYELPDAGLSDLERLCEIDTDAFILVPRTAEADDADDLLVTSDMAIGFKGDSAYQLWLDAGNTGTVEDYLEDIKGDPFTYEDFTPEQIEALKVKGDKGEPFLYSDFTPEQLEALKGEQGADGVGLNYLGTVATSANLNPSYQGLANDAFVTEDLGRAWKWTGSQWLDVGSFRGEKGDTGLQGLKGDKGDTGATGATGAQGIQGIQGLKGDKGDTGAQGLQGLKGDKGDTGLQGIQGEKGDTGNGIQSITLTATVGLVKTYTITFTDLTTTTFTVTDGADGHSPVITFVGTTIYIDGVAGVDLKGEKGEQGLQGIQGIQGEKGDTGLSGIYNSEVVASPTSGTLTLKNATETVLDGALTTSNVFTVALPAPVSGKVNESVLIFKIGATLPTITQPSGIVWRGSTPTLAINTNWTIVYEQVNTTGTTYEIWAVATKNA